MPAGIGADGCRCALMLAAALASASVGCVAAAERRATHPEAAAGAPPAQGEKSAGQVLAGTPVGPRDEPAGSPPSPEHVWVSGYWHWDGVRYVWQPGHWERSPSSAVR